MKLIAIAIIAAGGIIAEAIRPTRGGFANLVNIGIFCALGIIFAQAWSETP